MKIYVKTLFKAIDNFVYGYISERIVIQLFLIFFLLWIIFYGVTVSKGFHFTLLDSTILYILIPLFIIDAFKSAIETFFRQDFYKGTEELKKITVIIPTYNGGKVIKNTLVDLLHKFKPSQIIVSSNGSVDDTCDIVRQFKGVRIIETKQPIGKVGAINVALSKVKTQYTLIMDDDVLIGNATFPTNPLGENYSGIALRVLPIITNWLTKVQTHEYRKSMDIGKVFHNSGATVQNISGAIGIFKTDELKRQVQIHTGEFCGEDLQRTLLIHLAEENKGVVIVDSLVLTEIPDSIGTLFKQRVCGWNPGMYSNLGNYLRLLFRKNTPLALRYDAFYNSILVTLSDPLRVAAFPVLIFYPFTAILLYLIYVVLESVSYFALKRKDPYWVILLYPVYGVFNFITRITAFAVFMYRRFTLVFVHKKFIHGNNPDNYKNSHITHKFSSVIVTQIIMLVFAAILILLSFQTSHLYTNG